MDGGRGMVVLGKYHTKRKVKKKLNSTRNSHRSFKSDFTILGKNRLETHL